jgi:hypothetical protein
MAHTGLRGGQDAGPAERHPSQARQRRQASRRIKAVGRLRHGRGIPFAKLWMWLIGKRLPRRYQFPGVRS